MPKLPISLFDDQPNTDSQNVSVTKRLVDGSAARGGGPPKEAPKGPQKKKGGHSIAEPIPIDQTIPAIQADAPIRPEVRMVRAQASGIPSDYQRDQFNPMTKRQAKHAAFLARQQLTGKFTEDLMTIWSGQGPQILERAAFQNPMAFAKMVADLLPKQLDVDVNVVQELEDDQLADLISGVGEILGRRVEQAAREVEGRAREAVVEEPPRLVPPVR